MIELYNGIKQWLLLKALNLHKDRSKLVLIERMVTKRGKTFRQRFWVSPNGVEKTDKVLLNHHNLPEGHEQKPKDVSKPTDNRKYSNEVKKITNEYFDKFSDRQALYSFLRTQGIDWKDTDDPAIQWMRAKKATNSAVHNGYKLLSPVFAQNTAIPIYGKLIDVSKTPLYCRTAEGIQAISDLRKAYGNSEELAKYLDIPYNITMIPLEEASEYEEKTFGKDLKRATDEQRKLYRSLGIIGKGDKADKYLKSLLPYLDKEDSTALQLAVYSQIQKLFPKILRGRFSHQTVANSMSEKLGVPFDDIYTPFFETIGNFNNDKAYMLFTNQYDPETGHQEPLGDFIQLRKRIEQLKQHPEYKEIAEEFSKDFEDMLKIAKDIPNESEVLLCNVDPYHPKFQEVELKTAEEIVDHYKKHIKSSNKMEATFAQDKVKWATENATKIDEFLSARHKLSDPKYASILMNLALLKVTANEMKSYRQPITKPITKDFPILGKGDIELLKLYQNSPLPPVASRSTFQFVPMLMSYDPRLKDNSLQAMSKAYNAVIDEFIKKDIEVEGENVSDKFILNGVFKGETSPELEKFKKTISDIIFPVIEEKEIRSRIEDVPTEEYDKLSTKIIDTWDEELHGDKSRLTIKGIYKVSGMEMEKDFEDFKANHAPYAKVESAGKNCQVDEFYHGTDYKATIGILGITGYLLQSSGGMFGEGIYLADVPSKSAQYAGKGYSHGKRSGTLMIVNASLGSTETMQAGETQADYDTVDTVCGEKDVSNVKNNEWATHNEKAVQPLYIVDIDVSEK